MRHFLTFFLGCILIVNGQIENIEFDKNILLKRLYAGLNSKINTPVDSLIPTNQSSIRIGALYQYTFCECLLLETFGGVEVSNSQQVRSFTSFEIVTAIKNFKLHFGVFGTPNTVSFRPNPITWRSHSELYTETRFIGGRPGSKIEYQISDNFHMVYGYMKHDGHWVHHAKLKIHDIYIGGFSAKDEKFFLGFRKQGRILEIIGNYSDTTQEIALATLYNISKDFAIYYDLNYLIDRRLSNVVRLGGRRYLKMKSFHLHGFIAFEVDLSQKVLSGQLFINLR